MHPVPPRPDTRIKPDLEVTSLGLNSACIGNSVCPFANYNTTELARKIERLIYPNDFHVKIAVTGCPNDCIKAHMQDIGVIGMVLPVYDAGRCIGCGACVKNCRKVSSGALSMTAACPRSTWATLWTAPGCLYSAGKCWRVWTRGNLEGCMILFPSGDTFTQSLAFSPPLHFVSPAKCPGADTHGGGGL